MGLGCAGMEVLKCLAVLYEDWISSESIFSYFMSIELLAKHLACIIMNMQFVPKYLVILFFLS